VYRRTLIFGLAALCATVSRATAAAWALITKEEFEHDLSAAEPLSRSIQTSAPDVPVIQVEQPNQAKPIKPPLTIRVRFVPKAGAAIDPASFRITYGWLGVDITQRVLQHAHVSASGLSANNADIPAGHHRVTLQVADNMHRVGSRTFEFTVV